MFKHLVVIIYSDCNAAASYRLNWSLSEGFRVKKFWTNYQSGWSVQEIEIEIVVDGLNIKKVESIINYRISNNIK